MVRGLQTPLHVYSRVRGEVLAVLESMTAFSTGPCEGSSPLVPQRERWQSQVVTCCSISAKVTAILEGPFVQQMKHHL